MPSPHRINRFDTIKGIGILLVVAGHTFEGKLADIIYIFHMPLFFFLSGYLYHKQPKLAYLQKKIVHLVIPYVAFLLIIKSQLIVGFVEDIIISENTALQEYYQTAFYKMIVGGRLLTGSTGIFWFVTCLFFTQQFYNLISVHAPRKVGYIIIGCFIAASLNSYYKTPYPIPLGVNVSLMAIVYFHIGQLFKNRQSLEYTENINTLFILGLVAILGIGLDLIGVDIGTNMKTSNYGLPVLNIIFSLSFIILIFHLPSLFRDKSIFEKTIRYLGSASMVIMFTHQFFHFAVFKKLGVDNEIVMFLLCVLGSILIYEAVSRIPVLRIIFCGDYHTLTNRGVTKKEIS